MSKVILSGYYGMQNAGDDAFLLLTRRNLPALHGAAKVYVTACRGVGLPVDDLSPMYLRFPLVGTLTSTEFVIARGASYVFGGGSIFHTPSQLDRMCALLDRSGRRDHVAIGVSVGPFRQARAEVRCGEVLRRLSFVGVRDAVSLERARAIAPDARVELTFDLAPLLLEQMPPCRPARNAKRLVVALCSWERFRGGPDADEMRRCEAVAGAVAELRARDVVREVVLVDFNGHRDLGDRWVHDRLTLELQKRGVAPVQRIHYVNRPVEYLEVLASSGLCIAMRLHAAVFAYCVSTPAVVLSYHEKCDEWAAMIGQPAGAVVAAAKVEAEDLVAACGVAVSAPPTLEVGEALALAKRNLTRAAEAIGRRL